MKIKKCIVLLTFILVANSIYATGILKQSTNGSNNIHTVTVTNSGGTSISTKVSIVVGQLMKDFCYPSQSDINTYTFGPRSKTILYIDGNDLLVRFNSDVRGKHDGAFYDCGLIIVETDQKQVRDVFYLYHDEKTYNMTDPDSFDLQIN